MRAQMSAQLNETWLNKWVSNGLLCVMSDCSHVRIPENCVVNSKRVSGGSCLQSPACSTQLASIQSISTTEGGHLLLM